VGFISDLPTMLVAAFRATLEDVIGADVILHVRDVSHGDTEAQAADVVAILKDLGINPDDHGRIIEVWNKIDTVDAAEKARLEGIAAGRPEESRPLIVSAMSGEGLDQLKAAIERRLSRERPVLQITVEPDDGAGLSWVHEQTEVLDRRTDEEGHSLLVVRVMPEKEERLLRRFPGARRIRTG
jgi:GTP-binding protein HflX